MLSAILSLCNGEHSEGLYVGYTYVSKLRTCSLPLIPLPCSEQTYSDISGNLQVTVVCNFLQSVGVLGGTL